MAATAVVQAARPIARRRPRVAGFEQGRTAARRVSGVACVVVAARVAQMAWSAWAVRATRVARAARAVVAVAGCPAHSSSRSQACHRRRPVPPSQDWVSWGMPSRPSTGTQLRRNTLHRRSSGWSSRVARWAEVVERAARTAAAETFGSIPQMSCGTLQRWTATRAKGGQQWRAGVGDKGGSI